MERLVSGCYTLAVPAESFQPSMARAAAALQRGRGAEALDALSHALNAPGLRREDELAIRCAMAEAWLLRDDITQAATVLGRPPDVTRERIAPGQLSALWRLHGRLAALRGDQSRAIALLGRALKQAELALDSRAIGLAHYALGVCYRQVGDPGIVREEVTKAIPALNAAGDRRHLALCHSLTGIVAAQSGQFDEAMASLRQAERLATTARAEDVLALVCGNQANVSLMCHRHDQALALAERALSLHEHAGSVHGLAVALASLGQICVRLGDLSRAEQVLTRALEIRTPVQLHETTGAVFDTLAQIHLVRGEFDAAEQCLQQASEAYGTYGLQASRWYEWSIRLLTARLALRRAVRADALRLAVEIAAAPGVPAADAIQAELLAAEALLMDGAVEEAERRLSLAVAHLDPRATPGAWGDYLRLRAKVHLRRGRATDAYHDLAQSASVFDLLGERYQAALSRLALGRLVAEVGARSAAERYLRDATAVFESLGAAPDIEEARASARIRPPAETTGEYLAALGEADDVIVRRLVDAAVMPDLLALETASAFSEAVSGDPAVVFMRAGGDEIRVVSSSGSDAEGAASLARAALRGSAYGHGEFFLEPIGHEGDDERLALLASTHPLGQATSRRLRMIAAVARQGFALCGSRERAAQPHDAKALRTLDAVLPGFVCASAAMSRVVEQIERLQSNDLTVLITGESGTGKELVARAIHLGSPRSAGVLLPYNCTTTTRDLADSQLFGHRRGSFTGAVDDNAGLIRSAAGGSLFLDEIGDLPLEIQPKLLRFLEQGEVMPIGESRPQRVDVRVIAATNADLEQRVAEGKFREDLYYRLTVIRIHVPPLRERREEIPHLCALFLREACERLGKPDVQLNAAALDLFSQHWWPGNVRQLKNEIQRAVAMSGPDGVVTPEHLSPEFAALHEPAPGPGPQTDDPSLSRLPLGLAVDRLEREMIRTALDRSSGNISESARTLGLTRRGLYLKMKRLGLDGQA
jgi:DNA-binding NtrC family response regulator/tetratricopeptide (TPR) repeat protein